MKVLTLSGFKEDNRIKQMGNYNLYVPVCHYGMVESIHNLILQQIHKKGYLAIVVTNQSGVARGYLAEEMLQKLNAYLQKETGVDAIYYCPHLPPEQEEIPPYRIHCTCRKPNAGMLQQAAAGTKTVFVKGRKCSEQPDFVVSNVWEFAKSIKG